MHHGEIPGNSIVPNIAGAKETMAELAAAGIDFAEVTKLLEFLIDQPLAKTCFKAVI